MAIIENEARFSLASGCDSLWTWNKKRATLAADGCKKERERNNYAGVRPSLSSKKLGRKKKVNPSLFPHLSIQTPGNYLKHKSLALAGSNLFRTQYNITQGMGKS